jgi:hypothetical protein
MTVKFNVVHRVDKNNVGDIASNPLQYFLSPDQYKVIDVTNLSTDSYDSSLPMIIGGGGLIENEFMGDAIRKVLNSNDKAKLFNLWKTSWDLCSQEHEDIKNSFMRQLEILVKDHLQKLKDTTGKRIIWGAGHNNNVSRRIKTIDYPEWLIEFDLIGVRDVGQPYEWVPCASCMHPALKKKYPIKNDIVWFEHKKQLLKGNEFGDGSIPRFVNSGSNIEHTIELLGTANIIITNSYHGAYWGTLLGKKVIVVEPWSTKFYFLKHIPSFIGKNETLESAIDNATVYNNAYEECLQKTQKWWKLINS